MKTQLNSLNINAKWSYTVGKVYIGKSHWKYLKLKLKGIQHVVYLLSCTGGSLRGQTPLSGALTPSTLDLIGKPCSHLSCDSQLLHRTHFNPLTRRPETGSMTLRRGHALASMTQNELWSAPLIFHSWLINGVCVCNWRQVTPDLRGNGLLLIWMKLWGLWRKRKVSVFISITAAADDKAQIKPWHWLLC